MHGSKIHSREMHRCGDEERKRRLTMRSMYIGQACVNLCPVIDGARRREETVQVPRLKLTGMAGYFSTVWH